MPGVAGQAALPAGRLQPRLRDLPEDIQEVVGERAEAAFTIPVGVQSKAVGGQSVTFGAQAASGSTEAWTKCVARHAVRAASDV